MKLEIKKMIVLLDTDPSHVQTNTIYRTILPYGLYNYKWFLPEMVQTVAKNIKDYNVYVISDEPIKATDFVLYINVYSNPDELIKVDSLDNEYVYDKKLSKWPAAHCKKVVATSDASILDAKTARLFSTYLFQDHKEQLAIYYLDKIYPDLVMKIS